MPLAILVSLQLVCASLLGCSTTPAQPVPADVSSEPVVADLSDPQALYEQCRERVEGPQTQGECTTDADCTKGGCSGEICATPAALEGLMSTCEMLPCFKVLDTCGCHEGMCTWTVAAPAEGQGPPTVLLPPKDQLPAAPTANEPDDRD